MLASRLFSFVLSALFVAYSCSADDVISMHEAERTHVSGEKLSLPTIEALNELAATAKRRGATPPIIFDYTHGVTQKGDIKALKASIAAAVPGDVIEIPVGVYQDTGLIKLSVAGTKEAPIHLKAAEPGKVVFTGESTISATGDHWIIEGLLFDHAVFLGKQYNYVFSVMGAKGVRITQCAFISCGSPDIKYYPIMSWRSGAANGRIDHCTFVNSLSMTLQIGVGPKETDTAKNILIDHNHFRDIRRRHTNGGEAVQIGGDMRQWGHLHANTIVEKNVFERADGDDEVISNKSSGNTIRNNTFLGCGGAIWLRGGGHCLVSGNYTHRGYSGIVAFGHNHTIQGNVIEGIHSFAILIHYGSDWKNVEFVGHSFEVFNNSVVEENAIINPIIRGLVYGSFRDPDYMTQAPYKNRILNNILMGSSDRLLMAKKYGETVFEGNLIAGEAATTMKDIPAGFSIAQQSEITLPKVLKIQPNAVGANWLQD